jgi:hypothetical protein
MGWVDSVAARRDGDRHGHAEALLRDDEQGWAAAVCSAPGQQDRRSASRPAHRRRSGAPATGLHPWVETAARGSTRMPVAGCAGARGVRVDRSTRPRRHPMSTVQYLLNAWPAGPAHVGRRPLLLGARTSAAAGPRRGSRTSVARRPAADVAYVTHRHLGGAAGMRPASPRWRAHLAPHLPLDRRSAGAAADGAAISLGGPDDPHATNRRTDPSRAFRSRFAHA